MELLHDTNFWVLISFVIFVGVAWKYGKSNALKALDDNINLIKKELTQAESLRVDAQELLAEYQRKHKDALTEADKIIAQAKKHAENIREKAELEMDAAQRRRQEQLQEKLSRIEQKARQDIESYTSQIAVNATRDILKKNMDSKSDKSIIQSNLDSIPKAVN